MLKHLWYFTFKIFHIWQGMIFFLVWGSHSGELMGYSWLYAQESFLMVLGRPNETQGIKQMPYMLCYESKLKNDALLYVIIIFNWLFSEFLLWLGTMNWNCIWSCMTCSLIILSLNNTVFYWHIRVQLYTHLLKCIQASSSFDNDKSGCF